jgi:hypothetical protein
MRFLMIVSDPAIAAFAARHGVDRLMVDLETLGKAERQPGDTWKSAATMDDVAAVRDAAPDAEVLVRLNPLHDGTAAEIEAAIARGADWLMQPMWRTADDARRFADLVRGRARLMPLAETAGALDAIPDLLRAAPPAALLVGLNDLSLDLGRRFMFQPMIDGTLDAPSAALRAAGIDFGIGGIARAGEGALPPEILLGDHVRLGSGWAILSRTFHRMARSVAEIEAQMDFAAELARLRAIHRDLMAADAARLAALHAEAARIVAGIVAGFPQPPSGTGG